MVKIIVSSAILFSFFMASCTGEKKETVKPELVKEAFLLQKKEVSKSIHLPAELLPIERAEIKARLNAYVSRVLVDIGDAVKKNQVLIVLEAPEMQSQIAEAKARYDEAQARARISRDRYQRLSMAATLQGAVSEAELIQSRNGMLADSAALLSAASLARSYEQLQSYLTIRAPFNGIISARMTDSGDFAGSSGKGTLLVIERPDKLRMRIHVPESMVNQLPAGDSISFTVDAIENTTFHARFSRRSGSINRDTRTELWEYEYQNSENLIKPGMYANALLHLGKKQNSFVVPASAVVTTLEKKFVVKVENNEVAWMDVKEGFILGSEIEIFGDLNEGDVLLVRGTDEIRPGTAIKTSIKE